MAESGWVAVGFVGRYNPQTDPSTIDLDTDKIQAWIDKGAQPSDSVRRLLKAQASGPPS